LFACFLCGIDNIAQDFYFATCVLLLDAFELFPPLELVKKTAKRPMIIMPIKINNILKSAWLSLFYYSTPETCG